MQIFRLISYSVLVIYVGRRAGRRNKSRKETKKKRKPYISTHDNSVDISNELFLNFLADHKRLYLYLKKLETFFSLSLKRDTVTLYFLLISPLFHIHLAKVLISKFYAIIPWNKKKDKQKFFLRYFYRLYSEYPKKVGYSKIFVNNFKNSLEKYCTFYFESSRRFEKISWFFYFKKALLSKYYTTIRIYAAA